MSAISEEVRGSNAFAVLNLQVNLEPDLRSGSGWQVNLNRTSGPVRKSSGSNLGSEPDCGITRTHVTAHCKDVCSHTISSSAPHKWVPTHLCHSTSTEANPRDIEATESRTRGSVGGRRGMRQESMLQSCHARVA
jgi:hypothetical protein